MTDAMAAPGSALFVRCVAFIVGSQQSRRGLTVDLPVHVRQLRIVAVVAYSLLVARIALRTRLCERSRIRLRSTDINFDTSSHHHRVPKAGSGVCLRKSNGTAYTNTQFEQRRVTQVFLVSRTPNSTIGPPESPLA